MTNKKVQEKEPNPSALQLTEDLIRQRAYAYYEERGRVDGHDLEDWLRAEADILGKKPIGSKMHKAAAA